LGSSVRVLSSLCEADFHVVDSLPKRSSPLDDSPTPVELPRRYATFKEYALQALGELLEIATEGGSVVAVSHGGLIKTLLRIACGSDRVCFAIRNTSVSVLEWDGGLWTVAYVNMHEHLAPHQVS
jgi:probable phosphoglycerate mutase